MAPLLLRAPHELVARRISPGDTVRLALLAGPADGLSHSIFFEVWDVDGAQPPNSHPRSIETFQFLAGSARAESDGEHAMVTAGDLLVLPAGTTHRIVNVGAGRLYAITTMVPDDGFAALVERGEPAPLDDDDLAVLRRA